VPFIGPSKADLPGLRSCGGDRTPRPHGAFGSMAIGIGTFGKSEQCSGDADSFHHALQNHPITVECSCDRRPREYIIRASSPDRQRGRPGCIDIPATRLRALSMKVAMTVCNIRSKRRARGLSAPPRQLDFCVGKPARPRARRWCLNFLWRT